MNLTTKTRYGTRAMLELALHYNEGPLSLAEIARRQELSEKYAETLMARLRAAGLVQSVRGAQGGYLLARDPDSITLRDVYEVMEGPEPPVSCISNPAGCPRGETCVTQEVWAAMHGAAMGVLESVTLAELAARHRQRQAASAFTYCI
ncbi:MAG: RrF2 family transcriptional regulator [Anaerolineae bacterium]|jgi:Rrf2 family protein